MSTDRLVALGARDDLLWICAHWPELRNALRPGGGNALNGMPSGGGNTASPIDVHVSDLMREITNTARFYGQILLEEVPPLHGCNDACYLEEPKLTAEECPNRQDPITTSHMPGMLEDIAHRYGHFTENDIDSLAFTDWAHETRNDVHKTLTQPTPATYVGPCRTEGCTESLYVGADREGGVCKACGIAFTLIDQRTWLADEFKSRLMTMSEIISALFVILGEPIPEGTVKSWISRDKLKPVGEHEPKLYRIEDAQTLAERRRKSA